MQQLTTQRPVPPPAAPAQPAATPPPAPWRQLPAAQQPTWRHHPARPPVLRELADSQPLVDFADVDRLARRLAAAAAGDEVVLQVGDCVEPFDESTAGHVAAKLTVLDRLAGRLRDRRGLPVVRVARIAGQYAKPRSAAMELIGGTSLPVFRGHLVNSEEPTRRARSHDPTRMLTGYAAAAQAHRRLAAAVTDPADGPWSSHEALVLDYEEALLREDPHGGRRYLTSTHFPWIGERTRQPHGAHVALARAVANPVACKIGPTARPDAVVRLCAALDPGRVPGRLTLITRMGHARAAAALPPIVAAVRRAGHPVVWVCDPMHGNTTRTASGLKVRHLTDIAAEAVAFRRALERLAVHPGGLHLEVAAEDVTECLGLNVPDEPALSRRWRSLCDPRLNAEQALALIDTFTS